jgi:predicted nuclease of predicted toxin-antitoxin system
VTLWLDEQISPFLAPWIATECGVECVSVVDLPVDRASDHSIFIAARALGAIIVTKDSDFLDLVFRLGPPPQVVWLTCGNRSNLEMKSLLVPSLLNGLNLLEAGEPVVEIAG